MRLSMDIEQDSKTFRAAFNIDNKDPSQRELILNKYVNKILGIKQGHVVSHIVGIQTADTFLYMCIINLEIGNIQRGD